MIISLPSVTTSLGNFSFCVSFFTYLFFLSLIGLISYHRNLLLMLIAFELLILSLCGFFSLISLYIFNMLGQIIVLLLVSLAGCESALGLCLILLIYKLTMRLSYATIANLKY